MSRRGPRPGDRVLVNWGLDEVEGVVEDVYGLGSARRAVVRIPFLGPDGEELGESITVPVPLGAIESILTSL